MANTIPVTQKPVPSSVSKDAYVLGIQDNGNGQQALYRLTLPTQHPPKYANLKSGSTITQEKCLTIIRLLNYTRPASTAL